MKKFLIIAVAAILIVGISFYLKNQSSYYFVKNEIGSEENSLNFKEEKPMEEVLQNEEEKPSEEAPQNEEEKPSEEVIQRSEEDIAMDKRIKEQRLKNEENYKKHGAFSSFDSGKGLAPKKTYEEIYADATAIRVALEEYIGSNTEIYPEYNDSGTELNVMTTIDPRFEELIWGTPKEDRKGLLKGHNDKDMAVMEVKRLDGEYDEVFLVRDPDTKKWSVEYIGNYYDFKKKVEENE